MKDTLPSGTFRRQIVVLTACVTAFGMIVLTVVLQLILAAETDRDVNRVLVDRAEAVASSTTSDTAGGPMRVPDADLDPGVVVYDATGSKLAGVIPSTLNTAYQDLSRSSTEQLRDVGENHRILAFPFTTRTGQSGVVVVNDLLTPYEKAERYALIVSLTTAVLATVAAAGIASWVTTRALRPVAVLATTAADWSEHDLSRRFGLGAPTNELTALAGTLDTLLDKVAAAIRSEQRLTSELAHELRTPLTTIQGTAELGLMRDDLPTHLRQDLEHISHDARLMASTISTLLELARNETHLGASGVCSLTAVVDEVLRSYPDDVATEVDIGDERLGLSHSVAVRALAPVVSNALRFADTRVRIHTRPSTAAPVELIVEDDGPGVSGDPERIFKAGTSAGGGSGAGLGLALAQRVARSAGGDVELERVRRPTVFLVRLPRA